MIQCRTNDLSTIGDKVARARWPFFLRHFSPDDFDCRCGCGLGFAEMRVRFLLMLDCAREDAGIPFVVRSGIRCEAHNRQVGGVKNSAHLHGWAADIKVVGSRARFKIMRSLHKVGFTRFGLYPHIPHMLHVDCDPGKLGDVIWFKASRKAV